MASNRAVLTEPASRVGSPHIAMWAFDDAPRAYQLMSSVGDGEEWLAHIPAALLEDGDPPEWWMAQAEVEGRMLEIVDIDSGGLVVISGRIR